MNFSTGFAAGIKTHGLLVSYYMSPSPQKGQNPACLKSQKLVKWNSVRGIGFQISTDFTRHLPLFPKPLSPSHISLPLFLFLHIPTTTSIHVHGQVGFLYSLKLFRFPIFFPLLIWGKKVGWIWQWLIPGLVQSC